MPSEPTDRPASELFGALLSAADRAGVGIVVLQIAPTLRAVFVSSRCAQILGLTVEELLQRPPLQLFPPERLSEIQHILSRHRDGDLPPPSFESHIRRPDGREVDLEFGIGATEIEGEPGSVIFMRDTTEAAEAKQTLRRSEARWRTLIECAPDAIAVSRGGRIIYANPAAARLLDYERPEDLCGVAFSDFLIGDDFRLMGERIAMLRLGSPPLGTQEYRARTRSGAEIVVEVTSILFEDLDGPAVIAFARDVTESRRLQAQLVRADRLAALGTMAAGVGHEINNPLAFILLALDVIERRAETPGAALDDEIVRPMLADVKHGVERIATITRQLHTFSRADVRSDEQGRGSRPAELRNVLTTVCRMVERDVKRRGSLVCTVGDLPAVRGDAGRLEQVFLNLLINAAQALHPTRSDGRVVVTARVEGDRVVVIVSDSGVGIAKSDLPRVYDPFFTTKPVGAGTGLGLSICHTILTEIGGEIAIDSQPDQGTTVRVSLPIARAEGAVGPHSSGTATGGRPRILIVDDEEAILRVLRRILADRHEVVTASSGEQALRHVGEGEFDLILIDLMMPVVDGIELYGQIRVVRPDLSTRVVFITGGLAGDRVDVGGVSVPVLRKPFSMNDVATLLQRPPPVIATPAR